MKVLLIDDHPLILSALQTVIRGLGDDVEVVGVPSANCARVELSRQKDFDLVLLDLQLDDALGFDVLLEFRAAYPALPVVVVSASDRSDDVIRSIELGAMGFVPKRTSNDTLAHALRLVMSGGIYVPPMGLGVDGGNAYLGSSNATPSIMQIMGAGGIPIDFQAVLDIDELGLSSRQAEVLALLIQGKPNKAIARELGIGIETIKAHVANCLRILGVNSRTQAVLAVSELTQRALANQRRSGAI